MRQTQQLAIQRARASFSIPHTTGVSSHLAEARDALGLKFRYADTFQAEADRLIDQTITDAQFDTIIGQRWPTDTTATGGKVPSPRAQTIADNGRYAFQQLPTDAPTNAIRGTRWAAY